MSDDMSASSTSNDPRFLPFTALVHYQVGSDVVDIDRTYETASQKIPYPKIADLFQYGYIPRDSATPSKAAPVTPSFKPAPAPEYFTGFGEDPFYDATTR